MADDQPKKCYPTYRCTRCGSTFFKVNKPATAEDLAVLAINPPEVAAANDMYCVIVHTCEDSGSGLGHLVGITPEDVVEEMTKDPSVETNPSLN